MSRRVMLALAGAVVIAAGCHREADTRVGPSHSEGMRIASFDFAESQLLAEMYAQVIESTGVPVVRLGPVGPREILSPALELDLVDLVPEYLGTALQYAGEEQTDPDPASAREELNERLEARRLTALAASPAQDKNVFVVTRESAENNELDSIGDLAGLTEPLRLGGPVECPDRPLCMGGLESIYGLTVSEFVPQRSLVFTAEALRRDEIDVGLMFSTAAELNDIEFVVLDDDRGMQPAENVVPVVRTAAIDRWGERVIDAIDAFSTELTTLDLRLLNAHVANGSPIEDVASDWLRQNALIGSG